MTVRRVSKGGGIPAVAVHLKELAGLDARTGWLETEHYPGTNTPLSLVAAANEFGAVTNGTKLATGDNPLYGGKTAKPNIIPPRPFMRPTVAAQSATWMALLAKGAKACLAGSITAPQVMEQVALKAAADVGAFMATVKTPPNAKSTIARKGFDAPLRHSGALGQKITGVVTKVGG